MSGHAGPDAKGLIVHHNYCCRQAANKYTNSICKPSETYTTVTIISGLSSDSSLPSRKLRVNFKRHCKECFTNLTVSRIFVKGGVENANSRQTNLKMRDTTGTQTSRSFGWILEVLCGWIENYYYLTLMLLLANLANTKICKNKWKMTRNPGIWVLILEYSVRAI